ncbi:enoyl-CoA hydratase/isomerase family protein [Phytohabitans houttuyneae]|uniref:Enoyl-CoA hydratase n=1 Tax=Phytohabitans houttuyneae TaxID=1076126 RepID=A0A6V8KIW9_9ACTN|nr:enoyl-CoA hydratase/isomerase family protein [Phytohabitans houttuyneae]GFJ82388.1 enoyl-CoA hydratase [Phytohabitans houttuyneae]
MSDLLAERHGGVLLLRFNRPERHNAIGGTLLRELAEAFDEAGRDDSVRVVVTTGVGDSYSVGADAAVLAPRAGGIRSEERSDEAGWRQPLGAPSERSERDQRSPGDRPPAREFLASEEIGGEKGLPPLSPGQVSLDDLGNAGRWTLRMWELDKPTIAAVNGVAVGGGFGIALLHDLLVAGTSARLGPGFAPIGIAPEMGISLLLPHVVGAQRAAELLYSGRLVGAAEARDLGLVVETVDDHLLLEHALERAARIAAMPPLGTRATKRLLRKATYAAMAEQLRAEYTAQVLLFDHPDTLAAMDRLVRRLRAKAEASGAG